MMKVRTTLTAGATAVLAALLVVLVTDRPGENHADAEPAPNKNAAGESEIDWERPRFEDYSDLRQRMVRRQIQRRVSDTTVLAAMSHVPRHKFVPRSSVRAAYADRPLFIGHGQTISQPLIVAYMTAQLDLEAGDKVLEVGTGSGYQAAVLSEITPHVYTIEIIRALATSAKKRLKELGYKTVKCKTGDGYYGWEEHAPYDAIIVTCAAGSIPPPLVRQLKPGGRMCIPVGPPGHTQQLILVGKNDEGQVRSKSLMPVRFVPLTRKVR
jgi:protein-L-isoaspartate(D-aspartate) O-methyltransferase